MLLSSCALLVYSFQSLKNPAFFSHTPSCLLPTYKVFNFVLTCRSRINSFYSVEYNYKSQVCDSFRTSEYIFCDFLNFIGTLYYLVVVTVFRNVRSNLSCVEILISYYNPQTLVTDLTREFSASLLRLVLMKVIVVEFPIEKVEVRRSRTRSLKYPLTLLISSSVSGLSCESCVVVPEQVCTYTYYVQCVPIFKLASNLFITSKSVFTFKSSTQEKVKVEQEEKKGNNVDSVDSCTTGGCRRADCSEMQLLIYREWVLHGHRVHLPS